MSKALASFKCVECGEEVPCSPTNAKRRKYCSRKCYMAHRRSNPGEAVRCPACEKTKSPHQKLCSGCIKEHQVAHRKARDLFGPPGSKRSCEVCGEKKKFCDFKRSIRSKFGVKLTCIKCWKKLTDSGLKHCISCNRWLEPDRFNNHRFASDGKEARCASCVSESKTGVSAVERDAISEAQGNRCAICGREDDMHGIRLSMDHDHDTGSARGILCRRCNSSIGYLGDDPNVVARALEYLLWHKNREVLEWRAV